MIGFRKAEAPQPFAGCQFRKVLSALLFIAEFEYWIHNKRALNGRRRPHTGISAFYLLHDQAIGGIIHATTTILRRYRRTERAHRSKLADNLYREGRTLRPVLNKGGDFPLNKLPHTFARQLLFVGEKIIHVVKVRMFEEILFQ